MSKNTYFRWSEENDRELLRQLLRNGRAWKTIRTQAFQGLNEKQLRNHYGYLVRVGACRGVAERVEARTQQTRRSEAKETENGRIAELLSQLLGGI